MKDSLVVAAAALAACTSAAAAGSSITGLVMREGERGPETRWKP